MNCFSGTGSKITFAPPIRMQPHATPWTAQFSLGLDVLCGGQRAFINCTREVLLKDYMTLLPPNQAVAEILESVPGDDLVKAACGRLKEAGFMIALDDFLPNDPREPLTEFADIIKVDIRQVSTAEQATMIKRYGTWRCRLLAEKA